MPCAEPCAFYFEKDIKAFYLFGKLCFLLSRFMESLLVLLTQLVDDFFADTSTCVGRSLKLLLKPFHLLSRFMESLLVLLTQLVDDFFADTATCVGRSLKPFYL